MNQPIVLPRHLNSAALESVYAAAAVRGNEPLAIDATRLREFTFGGICGLVALVRVNARRVRIILPKHDDVLTDLIISGFIYEIEGYAEVEGKLPRMPELEMDPRFTRITPIGFPGRIEDVYEGIPRALAGSIDEARKQPPAILERTRTIFASLLSDVAKRCELVPQEFVGNWPIGWVTGYIAWDSTYGNRFSMAVVDVAETALQGSAAMFGKSASNDIVALEQLLFASASRSASVAARTSGLAGLRKVALANDGLLSVRSGTACIRLVPSWARLDNMERDLPYFPGIQIGLTILAEE